MTVQKLPSTALPHCWQIRDCEASLYMQSDTVRREEGGGGRRGGGRREERGERREEGGE